MGSPHCFTVDLPADDGVTPSVDRLRELVLADPAAAGRGLAMVRLHPADYDRLGGPPAMWFPSGAWVRVTDTGRRPGVACCRYRTGSPEPLGASAVAPAAAGGVAPQDGPVDPDATGTAGGDAAENSDAKRHRGRTSTGVAFDELFVRPPTSRQREAVLALFDNQVRVPTRRQLLVRFPDLDTPSALTKRLRNVRRRVKREFLPLWDAAVRRPTAGRHADRVRPMQLSSLENI